MKVPRLNPLILGQTSYSSNLIQGPLAGISCAPFRVLTARYSQPAFSCTEMISCKTLLHQSSSAQKRLVMKDSEEGPLCFQLAGSDPNELALATKIVSDLGADLINLNCGCPVKKIRRKGAGSSLLLEPLKLLQLIQAMKQSTHLPVSIKIRVENQDEIFHEDLLKVLKDSGLDFLIVHGRHWTEHYDIPCRYDSIAFFAQNLKIPVIGNGDVACIASLERMLATGCAAVMIARAGVGQPWLIKKLTAEINQEVFITPSLQEIGAVFMEHVLRLKDLLEDERFAILQARKFAKYYARPLTTRAEFCMAVNECENLKDLERLTSRYFNGSS